MPSNGDPEVHEISATVYPGMFEGELQVSVKINDEEINLIVSTDFVTFTEPLSDEGVKGTLRAEVVEKTDEGILISLPGEVQGASNRVYAAAS